MSDPVSKLAKSDPDLMRFAANAADYGSLITDRWDLIVRAGKGLGRTAPACFIPSTAEIEIDADSCCKHDAKRLDKIGWHLDFIDMVKPSHRKIIPVTTGAFAHECGHSLYTLWPVKLADKLAKEPAQLVQLALKLEEGRQEARLIQRDDSHKEQLQAAFQSIILPGFAKLPDDDPAALLSALALVIYRGGWDSYADSCVNDIYGALSRIPLDRPVSYGDFMVLTPTEDSDSNDEILELARKWWNLLPESAKDKTPYGNSSASCHSDNEESGDSGESGESGDSESESGKLGKTLKSLADHAKRNADEKATDDVAEATDSEKNVGGSEASSKTGTGKYGKSSAKDAGSGVVGYRPADPKEIAISRKLARILQSAQSVTRIKTNKKLPPGRLRGRAAVDWSRDRSLGIKSDVALFKGKTKGDSIPPIRLGIGLDVSGSMVHLTGIAASLGWTLAAAAWDSEALVSGVCFGSGLMPYAEVGKAFKNVRTLSAASGMEAIGSACEYLDSQVDLIRGDGPRILVIISDLEWVDAAERNKGTAWLQTYVKSGGTILYVGIESDYVFDGLAKGAPRPNGKTVFNCKTSLDDVTATITKLIRKAYDGI